MPIQRVLTGGLLGAVVLLGVSYALAPRLQSAKNRVEAEASQHLEIARRILHQYNAELDYSGVLWDQLRSGGVETGKAGALPEGAADDYQKAHAELWKSFEPVDRGNPDRPTAAKASYGNVASQVREGLAGREKLVKANERLLPEAMTAIDEALAVSVGEESGRSHAEANRLKGVVQYHQGLGLRIRAAAKRSESVPFRSQLVALAGRVTVAGAAKGMAAGSGCDERSTSLRKEMAELSKAMADDRKKLMELDSEIVGLESRIAAAEAKRRQASEAMEQLRKKGIDFADPQGAEAFGGRMLELDRAFRDADRAAHVATHGDFPKATIDATGDFLTGKYVESGSTIRLTPAFGVLHYRTERHVLAERIAGAEAAMKGLEAGVAELGGMHAAFAEAEAAAAKETDAVRRSANEVFEAMSRVNAEAHALEEKALDVLKKSADALKQAVAASGAWVSEARERTDQLKPEAQERSGVHRRTKDGWMAGFTQAQTADPLLARSWIFADRYAAYAQSASLLREFAETLGLKEADAAAEQEKAEGARTAGVAEVRQAMALLEKAHKEADRHWTLVAQAGGTEYLLALLGDPAYVSEAAESYRKALQGREEAPYAQPIASRLRRLEAKP